MTILNSMRSEFRILSVMIVLWSGLCVPAHSADEAFWPQFRGPLGNGHADDAQLAVSWSEEQNVTWKTAIHGRAWSSPVIWGNQIWLSTASEDGKQMSAVCIDRETGAVVHDRLLFENAEPRFCHAMNSYGSPSPVIEGDRVYLHFGSYGTACLDCATARTIWSRRDLPCDHFRGPGSSPLLYRDRLFIHYDGADLQYVVALDKQTGTTIWKVDRVVDYGTDNGDIMKAYCTPIVIDVNGRDQLISPTSKAVLAYDPGDGSEIWRVRYDGFSATARPVFGNGLLYVNSGFSKAELLAIRPTGSGDVTTTHVAWELKKSVPSKSSQLLVDDLIYMVHDQGVLTCIEASNGETVWQERLGGQYSASPIIAGSRIYVFDHEGTATVFKHGRKFERLSTNRLDDGCMASPAVAGNSLFVRTRTNLYRIDD